MAAGIGGAWLVVVGVQLMGQADALHHHTLIEGGIPLWVAAVLFLLGWQVMVAAMMLPASMPAIEAFTAGWSSLARPGRALAAFLASYAVAWTVFGLLAFLGDVGLHHLVDTWPWLEARPWLIEAGVIGLAGAYQFSLRKRRSLAACRHPSVPILSAARPARGAYRLGLDHGLACLGSSWALMLLMFAEGFASLGWMAALTAVMVYEATGRHGQGAAAAVGAVLLGIGGSVVVGGLI